MKSIINLYSTITGRSAGIGYIIDGKVSFASDVKDIPKNGEYLFDKDVADKICAFVNSLSDVCGADPSEYNV